MFKHKKTITESRKEGDILGEKTINVPLLFVILQGEKNTKSSRKKEIFS